MEQAVVYVLSAREEDGVTTAESWRSGEAWVKKDGGGDEMMESCGG